MRVCALCFLISSRKPLIEIPEWCKSHINLDLSQVNQYRESCGGKVLNSTIIPDPQSRFQGHKINTSDPGLGIWNGMKRCDDCIQKIINEGVATLSHMA